MLKKSTWLLLLAPVSLLSVGCEGTAEDIAKKAQTEAGKALDAAKEKGGELAEKGSEMAGELAEKGTEIAGQLGEQAMALLGPLKDKVMGLESLISKPEEMKTAVTELLGTLDGNLASLPMPEGIKSGIAALKEQLTQLLEYLGGAVEPEKLQGFLKTIKDIAGSQLG